MAIIMWNASAKKKKKLFALNAYRRSQSTFVYIELLVVDSVANKCVHFICIHCNVFACLWPKLYSPDAYIKRCSSACFIFIFNLCHFGLFIFYLSLFSLWASSHIFFCFTKTHRIFRWFALNILLFR